MARIFAAFSVLAKMPETRPPMPARQYILPEPSRVMVRAAKSARAPTSEPPEQGKINFGAPPQAQVGFSLMGFPFMPNAS